jgi:toxin-antitoxin system PIN domain toxin
VIAVDTNILVYAHRRESHQHRASHELLRVLAEGNGAWSIPWPCIYEFYSVVTNPRIWKDSASTQQQAWQQIDAWTAAPSVSLLHETDGFLATLHAFVCRPKVRGPVVHDARVAALCVAHGIDELFTADRDFALFPELVTRNPLSS